MPRNQLLEFRDSYVTLCGKVNPLLNYKTIPILTYGLEALQLNKTEMASIEHPCMVENFYENVLDV